MADYSVTAANVLASANAQKKTGTAGATITAGQSLYIDTADSNKLKLYDANAASPANVMAGIALHASLAGQPITYVISDPAFTPGFAITAGATVIGSATPGGLCPDADKVTGWYVNEVGHGISTTQIKMAIVASGVAVP
jgi:hypothetical protein